MKDLARLFPPRPDHAEPMPEYLPPPNLACSVGTGLRWWQGDFFVAVPAVTAAQSVLFLVMVAKQRIAMGVYLCEPSWRAVRANRVSDLRGAMTFWPGRGTSGKLWQRRCTGENATASAGP